jgi:glycosyltransferase involved in cell wall biosynthesis
MHGTGNGRICLEANQAAVEFSSAHFMRQTPPINACGVRRFPGLSRTRGGKKTGCVWPVEKDEQKMGGPKLHIVFVINSLVGGGAERALINIIAGLEPFVRDHRVSLILLDDLPSIYQVPSFVEKHVLNSRERFGPSMVNLTKLMRSIKPDVAISFLSRANCANVFASKIAGYPAIISERVHTSNHFGYGVKASLQKIVIGLFYRRAKQIIAVSSGVARDLAANFKVAPERLTVIHNPIDMSKLTRMSQDKAGVPAWPRPYIAAVGRLVPNKNFAMMLCAFAQSGDPGNLVILGDGPERATLEALSVKLGIQDRVFMPGFVSNPFPAIAGAKYLVSSSNAEGFPNAIVEAMALGCAVIATDCEAGPADILSPDAVPAKDQVTRGAYGFLVPVQKPSLLA